MVEVPVTLAELRLVLSDYVGTVGAVGDGRLRLDRADGAVTLTLTDGALFDAMLGAVRREHPLAPEGDARST